ncbi:hypothetical protein PPERSA_02401 [Pseudocohnilembus persalinus]|uniref:Coenzyme Q-binding protein COQ10 START domain-containing protein n=1 Tax=Pseudocohnilembus persalinus TaxID=266149 RepID=A0A0V0QBS0_PSEPJ|nr:hypothetical protein PPERSA_02401 [Pseudocohnilembus persalinus]|eukprot:KRW99543.1 hypothetical protein PPERSA_02401 [Pseudocohnilembus persalinus]
MIKKLSFLVRNGEKLNFCRHFQFFSYKSEEKETNNNNNNNNNNNSQIGYNQKIILKNCNPYEFFSLVYDVGNYKNFLPWCEGSNIVQRQSFEYFEGELVVNFQIHSSGYVSEVYTSLNVDKQGNFEYEIKSVAKKGKTLKNLESIWKIKSYPNNRFRINRDEFARHLQNGEIFDLLQRFEEKQLMKEIDIVKLEKLIQKKQNAKYLENGYKIYMKEELKENKNNNNKQNEVKFLHFIKNNFLHLS